ncbi:MAG: CidA/LrgA family protein [Clostridia bacterium]|nr:CidA/LrgA family protein [Clostridia bacterium]
MIYVRQFSIILLISLVGEALNAFLPLPVPASIYGIVLLFCLLCLGVIRLESVRDVSSFLIGIMPLMFIPAAAGLVDSFSLLLPSLLPFAVITVVSTVAVMAVSGRVTQALIRRGRKEKDS